MKAQNNLAQLKTVMQQRFSTVPPLDLDPGFRFNFFRFLDCI
jgi:hypothetical protein